MRSSDPAPSTEPDARPRSPAFQWLAAAAAALACAIAVVVLASWAMDRWRWTSLGEEYVVVAPSTALVLLLLAGGTLLRMVRPHSALTRTLGPVVAAVAAAICLAVGARALYGPPRIAAEGFAAAESNLGAETIGRMSLVSAGVLLFAAASLALVFAPFFSRRPFRYAGFLLAGFGTVFGSAVTLAYAAGAPLFYGLDLIPMAFLTAVAVVAIDTALMAVYASSASRRSGLAFEPWRPLLAIAAVGLAVSLGGFYLLRSRQKEQRDLTWRELSGIAALKAGQVDSWRQERFSDARFLMRAPFVAKDLARFFANPAAAEPRADVLNWLSLMKGGQRYETIAVFDREFRPVLAVPAAAPMADPFLRRQLTAAARTRQVVMGDIYLSEATGAVRLDVVAPVFLAARGGGASGDLEGLILLRIDPRRYLFPQLQSWPIPSATAETLLVRREGEQAVYLNELRHRANTALLLRRPWRGDPLFANGAWRGQPLTAEGLDYRGEAVLAAERPVPGTAWVLVAKMDQSEVFAPLRRQALTAAAILGALLLAAAMGFVIHWRRSQTEMLRRQREHLEAVVKERTAALDAEIDVRLRADERLRFHSDSGHLLQEISANLLAATVAETDAAIEAALSKLAAFARADSAYVFAFDAERTHCSHTHLWAGPALASRKKRLKDLDVGTMPWWMNQLLQGREVVVPVVAALPEAAATERGILADQGVASVVDVPMMLHGAAVGFIGLSSAKEGRLWQPEDIHLLRTLSQVIVSALQRKAAEEELQRHRWHLEELVAQRTAALYQSERRFQSLFEQARVAIGVSRRGRVLFVNPACVRLFGYERAEELAGMELGALIAPAARAAMAERLARRPAEEADPEEYEITGRRRDGSEFPMAVGVGRMELADGPATLALVADIADRKAAEAALRESEERFRNLVEHAPDAVFVGTASEPGVAPRFAYVNAAAVRLFGAPSPETLIGQPILDRIHPDHRAAVEVAMRERAQRQFSGPVEQVYLRLDGAPIPVEVAVARLAYRGVDGAVVFVRDITERKVAEETIREQTVLLETATDAIMVRDLEHRVLYWNKSAERLYGWSAGEILGHPAPDLQLADREPFLAAFAKVLEAGDWTGEMHHLTKTRHEITVLSRWSLVRDAQGRPKSIFVISTDITERKKLETQLYRAQRLESIGQLASGIAHDLNNILAPLIMVAPLLRSEIANPDTLRLVDILENNAKRGVDVVKQIMTFSRGMKGGRGPVPTRPLIKETINVLEETFPRSITVHSSLPEDVWTVEGDATQLHQVLMNLCVNARDAMPDGGTLTLAAENMEVDELYASMSPGAKPGPYVAWLVADTGTGIAPEIMDRIFDPFFTTKEPGKGTGLGLSTVLGIVRNHNGFIKVESKVGKGTQFRVYLPAQTAVPPAAEAPEPAPPPEGRGETVLVVDDEEGVRLLTKKILEKHGYHVLLAAEGSEAVVVYAQHPAEISGVLTDLMMPLMDGATLIRALKQITPSVRILATTGVTEGAQVAAALRLGAKEVLRKPYPPRLLLERLRALLDG